MLFKNSAGCGLKYYSISEIIYSARAPSNTPLTHAENGNKIKVTAIWIVIVKPELSMIVAAMIAGKYSGNTIKARANTPFPCNNAITDARAPKAVNQSDMSARRTHPRLCALVLSS